MTNNSGPVRPLGVRRHQARGIVWREIVWPGLIISCIGVAALGFLISCARVSVLELEVNSLQRQISEQLGTQRQLWQQIVQLRDRARLREFAEQAGMTLVPAGTDYIELPALPAPQWVISPLTSHPETLVSQRQPRDLEKTAVAGRTIIADAF